jgi:hypothetical protein
MHRNKEYGMTSEVELKQLLGCVPTGEGEGMLGPSLTIDRMVDHESRVRLVGS